ncbi:hypothetical protein L198_07974 [Cryptococcus wingfieldii CBS 7118]|uniref:NADP-dependent oxidoreductase domain-containing protein n=1 Tax=Cryptococcus wingfieldii CBS 7118 TaxID=1295528 RepID=A0A1E3HPW6_9TREE|nr:hypothetical protein L198_07974 [Cryptococcus wingfieldii CBS 7118]ODN78185.1 hypothetical protein L198_07974 [Cryptococcus wingfieldii CBS 7118]
MPFTQVTLNDGHTIPGIGFGTWKVPNEVTAAQVTQALEAGFRHIDTAEIYGSEAQVGQALSSTLSTLSSPTASLKRKDIYITTKWFNISNRTPRQSLLLSLQNLGLDYVDLYLVHQPFLVKGDFEGVWREFEGLKEEGLARSIGVSNYTKEQLEQTLASATTPPAVNQILLHPYVISKQGPLLAYLAEKNIVAEGYSSLVPITSKKGGPLDGVLEEIAGRLQKTPGQVLFGWSKAKRAVIVTSSSKKDRLESYLAVGDITLTDEDVRSIDEAGIKGDIIEE